MNQKTIADYTEIPVSEIRQQLEYAQVVCEDLFNMFAAKNQNICRDSEHSSTETKLSMLLDFICEATCWCSILETNRRMIAKTEKEEV